MIDIDLIIELNTRKLTSHVDNKKSECVVY